MEPSETIGQRIRQVRGELSQKAFGARIGLSQTAVTALESGQSEPRLGTFNSIVEAFGLSPEWLRTGKMPEPATSTAGEPAATPSPIQSPNPDVVTALLNQLAEQAEQHRRALKEQRKADLITMQAQANQWQWAYDDLAKQRDEWKGKAEWYEVLLNMRVPTQEQDLQLQKMRHNTPQPEVKPATNPIGWQPGERRTAVQEPQGEEVEMSHQLGGMAQDFNWQQINSPQPMPADDSALRISKEAA